MFYIKLVQFKVVPRLQLGGLFLAPCLCTFPRAKQHTHLKAWCSLRRVNFVKIYIFCKWVNE